MSHFLGIRRVTPYQGDRAGRSGSTSALTRMRRPGVLRLSAGDDSGLRSGQRYKGFGPLGVAERKHSVSTLIRDCVDRQGPSGKKELLEFRDLKGLGLCYHGSGGMVQSTTFQ